MLVETTVVAGMDLTRLVLPDVLDRGEGDLLFLGLQPILARHPPPVVYSAAKPAVEGLADGLRAPRARPASPRCHRCTQADRAVGMLPLSGTATRPSSSPGRGSPGPGPADGKRSRP